MKNSRQLRDYKKFSLVVWFIILVVISVPCTAIYAKTTDPQFILFADKEYKSLDPEGLLSWMDSLTNEAQLSAINIVEPLSNTTLPPDMASPLFMWEDPIKTLS